mmetsp:Transcript_6570/g.15227  ORF Transcript_6570/g.15227 Transcript_6570/m.15227 type:complete len:271 (-) Transcript_6570:390-1202(-)
MSTSLLTLGSSPRTPSMTCALACCIRWARTSSTTAAKRPSSLLTSSALLLRPTLRASSSRARRWTRRHRRLRWTTTAATSMSRLWSRSRRTISTRWCTTRARTSSSSSMPLGAGIVRRSSLSMPRRPRRSLALIRSSWPSWTPPRTTCQRVSTCRGIPRFFSCLPRRALCQSLTKVSERPTRWSSGSRATRSLSSDWRQSLCLVHFENGGRGAMPSRRQMPMSGTSYRRRNRADWLVMAGDHSHLHRQVHVARVSLCLRTCTTRARTYQA